MNQLEFTTPSLAGITAYVGEPDTMPHPATGTPVRRWHRFNTDLILRPRYAGQAFLIPDATHEQVICAFNPD